MVAAEDRVGQFKADIAKLKVRTGNARRDGVVQIVGAVLMAIGPIAALLVYQSSRSQSDPRDIQSETILALAFVAIAVVGAAMFLFASLAKFLRFWLLRQLYEGQGHIDQVVAAVRGPSEAVVLDGAVGAVDAVVEPTPDKAAAAEVKADDEVPAVAGKGAANASARH
jgi:hypothetical protein